MRRFLLLVSACLSAACLGLPSVWGQPTAAAPPLAQAWDPAEESYQAAEAQRLDAVARQRELNYQMRGFGGYGPVYADVFEPWQSPPGDIWGYRLPQPVEHPIGQENIQTGPNRWISRPVYAAPAQPVQVLEAAPAPTPGPVFQPQPPPAVVPAPAEQPQRPAPADARPEDYMPSKRPAGRGPRAF